MADFENHTPNLWSVRADHYLIEPAKTQSTDYLLLLLREPDSTSDQLNPHWFSMIVLGTHSFTSARPPLEIFPATEPHRQHSSTASAHRLWL